MKQILLFGAGKSASVLIDQLLTDAAAENWRLTVVDTDQILIESKIKGHRAAVATVADVTNDTERGQLIQSADLVISMMPPTLHALIARDCVRLKKHLLTASYADDIMRELSAEAEKNDVLLLCEMGLDPGIDHMSAMELIDRIKAEGGTITSFTSHCGGLVAPESDDNPWHYKISWNPRNVVLAGKAGARYKTGGTEIVEVYEELFDERRNIDTKNEDIGFLSWYPNRDSLSYIRLYGLQTADTFIRTTLRHRDFMLGWQNIVAFHLTDETPFYNSDGMSLAGFFEAHIQRFGLAEEIIKMLEFKETLTHDAMEALAADPGLPTEASLEKAGISHDINKVLHQLYYIGIDDTQTFINKGLISAADALQFALEKKLPLNGRDKDMIVMQHEIDCRTFGGEKKSITSSLVVKGKNGSHTAMAETVGLPLAIAAKLLLRGELRMRGLQLPVIPEIYLPVLAELKRHGILFSES